MYNVHTILAYCNVDKILETFKTLFHCKFSESSYKCLKGNIFSKSMNFKKPQPNCFIDPYIPSTLGFGAVAAVLLNANSRSKPAKMAIASP